MVIGGKWVTDQVTHPSLAHSIIYVHSCEPSHLGHHKANPITTQSRPSFHIKTHQNRFRRQQTVIVNLMRPDLVHMHVRVHVCVLVERPATDHALERTLLRVHCEVCFQVEAEKLSF